MHPERHGEGDPRRQSSLPSSLHSLIIGPQQQRGDEPPEPSSSRGESREGWNQSSRAFRPVPSFPDPDYAVGSLAPAAFDEGDRHVGDRPRRRTAEPLAVYPDDPRLRRPTTAQLPPLQAILPGGTSPAEPGLRSLGQSHGYTQPLSLPPPEPPRLPPLRVQWEGQAGPSSQPQRLPPARHGYSYPMPQAQEPAVLYSHPPPRLHPASSSFPPPRYGGYYEPGGEYPSASSSRQPSQSFPESFSLPPPGLSRAYEAGRGRLPEARSEVGSPIPGSLRRHLDPEGQPDDPRRGRSLPPRRSAGASSSRPLPSRLLEAEERGVYPPPHGQPLPYSRGSPVGVERPGDAERRRSPAESRTPPGSSRRSVSPADRRTTLPSREVERPLLHRYESVPNFRAPPATGYGHGGRSPFPLGYQSSTQYDPATMAPRYPIGVRLPVSTPYSYDPNAPPPSEVEALASPRYSGPLFSEPRSYQHSLTSHSTHSGDDGNSEDSASRRAAEDDPPPQPEPPRRTLRKRRRGGDVEPRVLRADSPSRAGSESPELPPRKQSKKTEKACFFCRKRKLKCDGKPLCGNCARRQVECTYQTGAPKRRGPGKKNREKQAAAQAQGQTPMPELSGPFTFTPPDPYSQPGEGAAMHPHAMFRHDAPMPMPSIPGRASGSAERPSEERLFSFDVLGESLGREDAGADVVEEGSGGQGSDEEEDGSTPPPVSVTPR